MKILIVSAICMALGLGFIFVMQQAEQEDENIISSNEINSPTLMNGAKVNPEVHVTNIKTNIKLPNSNLLLQKNELKLESAVTDVRAVFVESE